VLALIALGYKQSEAQKTVQTLLKEAAPGGEGWTVDKLVRAALRSMK
jgi:Holliday junction DNA helicase RuvA